MAAKVKAAVVHGNISRVMAEQRKSSVSNHADLQQEAGSS
jgi:hypothetical protein